jgi:hypothetical protein
MIVRLTRRQHKRVAEIVADQMGERWRSGVLEWIEQDVSDAAKHRVDVAMPAIAWRRTWDVMFDHCFDNRGMRTKGVRVTDLNATKAIRRGLNVREVHPALSRTGAIGMIGELVPAWKLIETEGSMLYTPYPRQGMQFVVLAPESREVGRQRVTQWVEAPRAPERPLLDESNHWRFA